MDFLLSVMHSVPFLKNVFTQKKKQPLSASRSDLECIAPLFQSVQENPHPIPTQVTGTIPEWIHGSLLRNGPGKFEFGKDMYKHWFDGMSLMHKFTMKNGSVSYMSKFLQSDTYQINKRENRIVISEFGTCALPDPCRSLFQRFMSMFEMPQVTDNGNINFMQYQGDYYVSTETNVIYKVDPEMLETRDKVDWSRYIAVNAATAHPHYDPDGTAYNMGNSYGSQGTFYNIIRIPVQESEEENILHGAQVLCSIPAKDKLKPSYYHSFGMTENYAVFVEQPLKLNILKILTSNISGSTISDCLSWEAKFDNIFHVINKHTGEIHPVTFHAKPFVTIHQINAFEDQGCIVLDLCCIDDGGFIHNYALQNLRKSGQALDEVYNSSARAFPRRFVLPLNIDSSTPYDVDLNPLSYTSSTAVKRADGKVWCTHQDLHDHRLEDLGGFEFPHINYSKSNTRNYRYFYGCGFQHLVGSSLIKVNLITKDLKVWQEDGFYPSEPVFVPCPDAVEEDDGVILSVVVTPSQDKNTFLLVLDAKSFSELGRAEVPVQMPYGFHGMFVSHRREAFI